jgi:hypothetical protein
MYQLSYNDKDGYVLNGRRIGPSVRSVLEDIEGPMKSQIRIAARDAKQYRKTVEFVPAAAGWVLRRIG